MKLLQVASTLASVAVAVAQGKGKDGGGPIAGYGKETDCGMWSFKCSTNIFLCGVTEAQTCENGNKPTVQPITDSQCAALIAAVTADTYTETKCPDGHAISHFSNYCSGDKCDIEGSFKCGYKCNATPGTGTQDTNTQDLQDTNTQDVQGTDTQDNSVQDDSKGGNGKNGSKDGISTSDTTGNGTKGGSSTSGTTGGSADDTCPAIQQLGDINLIPNGKHRCCEGTYNGDDSYGSCETSSCIANFGMKNLNCHNYGSPQNPIGGTKNKDPTTRPAGSNNCPYMEADRAICDTSKYTEINKGLNCRDNTSDNHCLGEVKCMTDGVTVPKNEHSDGTAPGGGACSFAEDGFGEGTLCFYLGASENFKVCEGVASPSGADVQIDNAVTVSRGGAGCKKASNMVEDDVGTDVTYCFTVVNTGVTYLKDVTVTNADLNDYKDVRSTLLAPGEEYTLEVSGFKIDSVESRSNTAFVVGTPVDENGNDLSSADKPEDDDDSEIKGIDVYNAEVTITNLVTKDVCDNAADMQTGVVGTEVVYCIKVENTGNTYLTQIVVTDPVLGNFKDTRTEVLAPGASYLLEVTGLKIDSTYGNTAFVEATPVNSSGESLGLKNVADKDPSNVATTTPTATTVNNPNIMIDNEVYAGTGSCSNAKNMVQGDLGTEVTYCFEVTNMGNTYLKGVTVTNPTLNTYEDVRPALLGPGEHYTLEVTGFSIDQVGTLSNTAYVVGIPVDENGEEIVGLPHPEDDDDSEIKGNDSGNNGKNGDKVVNNPDVVDNKNDGSNCPIPMDELKTGTKSSTEPGMYVGTECMETNFKCHGNQNMDLVCRAKEVVLESVSSPEAKTCKPGEKITVTLDAVVSNKAVTRYDFGWYIATDGGNALTGTCAMKYLAEGDDSIVVDDSGDITWGSDPKGNPDVCGDFTIVDKTSKPSMAVPLCENLEVTCADGNDDGYLDVSVCFSWRTAGGDETCEPDVGGLYPANAAKCRCVTMDVPEIQIYEETVNYSTCV